MASALSRAIQAAKDFSVPCLMSHTSTDSVLRIDGKENCTDGHAGGSSAAWIPAVFIAHVRFRGAGDFFVAVFFMAGCR